LNVVGDWGRPIGVGALYDAAVAYLWVCAGCTAVLAFQMIRNPRKMWIMNIVWPVTALYFGPLAVWYYFRYGRLTKHERARLPFWHAAALGTTHCGAGCTLGDFAGEWLVFLAAITIAGSTLAAAYVIDFAFAYAAGIVFQYFSIAPMRGLHGMAGVKAAVKADTASLLAFEAGMFAFMYGTHVWFNPELHPDTPIYWLMMQFAMIAGFATSFPANWWLIRHQWKEQM
jgi:hypothetical protein